MENASNITKSTVVLQYTRVKLLKDGKFLDRVLVIMFDPKTTKKDQKGFFALLEEDLKTWRFIEGTTKAMTGPEKDRIIKGFHNDRTVATPYRVSSIASFGLSQTVEPTMTLNIGASQAIKLTRTLPL